MEGICMNNNSQDQKSLIRPIGIVIGSAVFAFLTHFAFITIYRLISFPATGGNDYSYQDFCFAIPSIVLTFPITISFLLRYYDWEGRAEWGLTKLILLSLIIGGATALIVGSITYILLGFLWSVY
jgi:hypothetical protein